MLISLLKLAVTNFRTVHNIFVINGTVENNGLKIDVCIGVVVEGGTAKANASHPAGGCGYAGGRSRPPAG